MFRGEQSQETRCECDLNQGVLSSEQGKMVDLDSLLANFIRLA